MQPRLQLQLLRSPQGSWAPKQPQAGLDWAAGPLWGAGTGLGEDCWVLLGFMSSVSSAC